MEGDILGLGGPIDKTKNLDTETPQTSFSHDEEAKRRRRMNEGADEVTPAATPVRGGDGHGATGIDMGAGGQGTDIE